MTIVNWWLSDPLFYSGVYRSHVEKDLSSLHFPQDDKDRMNVTPHKALSYYSEVSGSFQHIH